MALALAALQYSLGVVPHSPTNVSLTRAPRSLAFIRCQHIVSQRLQLKATLCHLLRHPNVKVALTAQQATNIAGFMAINNQQIVVMVLVTLSKLGLRSNHSW